MVNLLNGMVIGLLDSDAPLTRLKRKKFVCSSSAWFTVYGQSLFPPDPILIVDPYSQFVFECVEEQQVLLTINSVTSNAVGTNLIPENVVACDFMCSYLNFYFHVVHLSQLLEKR